MLKYLGTVSAEPKVAPAGGPALGAPLQICQGLELAQRHMTWHLKDSGEAAAQGVGTGWRFGGWGWQAGLGAARQGQASQQEVAAVGGPRRGQRHSGQEPRAGCRVDHPHPPRPPTLAAASPQTSVRAPTSPARRPTAGATSRPRSSRGGAWRRARWCRRRCWSRGRPRRRCSARQRSAVRTHSTPASRWVSGAAPLTGPARCASLPSPSPLPSCPPPRFPLPALRITHAACHPHPHVHTLPPPTTHPPTNTLHHSHPPLPSPRFPPTPTHPLQGC